jgi:hypothetical protein
MTMPQSRAIMLMPAQRQASSLNAIVGKCGMTFRSRALAGEKIYKQRPMEVNRNQNLNFEIDQMSWPCQIGECVAGVIRDKKYQQTGEEGVKSKSDERIPAKECRERPFTSD